MIDENQPARRTARRIAMSLPFAVLLGGCTTMGGGAGGVADVLPSILGGTGTPREASAMLRNAEGRDVGTALFQAGAGGTRVTVDVRGMPQGIYAMHIHAVGRCDAPDFTSAGGHWNPAMRQHGAMNPMGAHAGDLPNLTIGRDGRGGATVDLANVAVGGTADAALLDADGAAIVIHQQPDDMRTDPSGNSGARIACGVLMRR